jgi:transposase
MSASPSAVYVGIDVSKDSLTVHVRPSARTFDVRNDTAGCRRLVALLRRLRPSRIAIEPTGGYERDALGALRDAGLPVYRVNPLGVRRFAQATLDLAKTDDLDAACLARYAEFWQPPPPIWRSPAAERLAEHLSWRDLLVAWRGALACRADQLTEPALRLAAQGELDRIDQEIDAVLAAMLRILADDPALAEQARRLKTAPGIGDLSALAVIALLPELGRLDGKKIASLAGVAPHPCDSGRLRGRRIVQGGRAALRRKLYMAAVTAIRADGPLRQFFLRLRANGKPAKLALTAVLRKLLCRLNAMIRDRSDWNPNSGALSIT